MHVPRADLQRQIEAILVAWGMAVEHAAITAERLTDADVRGIDSHGVALLPLYAEIRAEGRINFRPDIRVVRESAVTALLDADHGLGHVPATMAMERAIAKARSSGLAAVAVRNSNHYGAAGVYGLLAARAGFIGVSMTSVWVPAIVPTFGAEPMFGTNPIGFVAPAANNPPFYLDMATSTVAVGKLKLAQLHGKPLPPAWAMDRDGRATVDPDAALADVRLTPLGGARETSGHKGYGLAAMVEILCTMLSGSVYAPTRERRHPGLAHWNIGHFMLALDPQAFRDAGEFEADLDDMIDALRAGRPAASGQPVLVHGDPECDAMRERSEHGIPVPDALLVAVRQIAADCGAPWLLS
jgi:LDH2 family malate/lactate/ureidoglycolate dehydrogenase